ncbi:MAG: class I SAM-dependent methyltransferase [Anaerolineae bacterium]|nr:class I SAM-dependent methyltransferase [Anaerolineae bacterium]
MPQAWARLIAFGFRLLYNELAWLYDPVSWVVSLGLWRRWQQTALAYLPAGGSILEVGFGPGHLLVDLATAGYRPFGLDLSLCMLRLTQCRLRRRSIAADLVRGRANALPFAACAFDAVVLTFPTPFVYDPAWIRHLERVLKPGARLIVVETGYFARRSLPTRFLEWLYRITGQRRPIPDLPGLLGQVGLLARRETVSVASSTVRLLIANKSE